jgi:hypothetical protein
VAMLAEHFHINPVQQISQHCWENVEGPLGSWKLLQHVVVISAMNFHLVTLRTHHGKLM